MILNQHYKELGLKVEKFGYDIKKDFAYTTVSNESGKIRVKGDIYKDEFWKYNREDRNSQIDNNERLSKSESQIKSELKKYEENLIKQMKNDLTKLHQNSLSTQEQEQNKNISKLLKMVG